MKLMRIKNACRDIISITPFKNNKMIAISAHFFFLYIVLILYKRLCLLMHCPCSYPKPCVFVIKESSFLKKSVYFYRKTRYLKEEIYYNIRMRY